MKLKAVPLLVILAVAAGAWNVAGAIQVTVTAAGQKTFNSAIHGQAVADGSASASQRQKTLEVSYGGMVRGVAGGLDADTYNWRTLHNVLPTSTTTLGFLREARDHNSQPLFTANTRGIGTGAGSDFIYTNKDPAMLAAMASDWVRYTNYILQHNSVENQPTGSDLAILHSLSWGANPALLTNAEIASSGRTPTVNCWEIGNEPDVNIRSSLPSTTLSAADYLSRYKTISAAMLATDGTIHVGPCVDLPDAPLAAILGDNTAQVDFISYHPYGPLNQYTTSAQMEAGLQSIKQFQTGIRSQVVAQLAAANRDVNTPLIASEWNPMSYMNQNTAKINSMAQALGVAETCFTFAELGMEASTYWLNPGGNVNLNLPAYKMFRGLQDHMGDTLVFSTSPSTSTRLYVIKNSKTNQYVLWGLNFSNSTDATLNINLSSLGLSGTTGTWSTLGWTPSYGDSGLLNPTDSATTVYIDWTNMPATGLNLSNLSLLLPHSEVTCLILAVPEPSSIALLLALIVSLLGYAWRTASREANA
jgi:hypothetical protein